MATDILVPPLSQTMDSLILISWSKKVGDKITKGEPLFQVETDKATLDVEAPASGVLTEILAEAGSEVLVRSKIGSIAAQDEALATPVVSVAQPSTAAQVTTVAKPQVEVSPEPSPAPKSEAVPMAGKVAYSGPGSELLPPERLMRTFASPRARHLAEEKGVSLLEIKATGPQAMIVERDVLKYLEESKSAPAAVQSQSVVTPVSPVPQAAIVQAPSLPGKGRQVALTTLRRTISRRMQESHQLTAAVTIMREVDATDLVDLRKVILNELLEDNPRPTLTDFMVVILAKVLLHHPEINGMFDGTTLELYDEVHMGVAVDTERGLVVPVISSIAHKGLFEVTQERNRLVKAALEGKLSVDELNGGTFTITNLGPLGVDGFTPIINPPQMAILGVGRIHPVAGVVEDKISIRQMMTLSLTFDHRVIDGAPAARFLMDVVQLVEKPQLIWL